MILKSHRRRVAAASFVLLSMFLVVTARLVQLQIVERGKFGPNGPFQTSIHLARGTIYDRNMNKLALSVPVLSLFADPYRVGDAAAAADKLASVLLVDREVLLAKLSERRRFVWLARKLDREAADAVRALHLKGVGFKREDKRQYPSGSLAANLLGFVGIDEEGLEGVEYEYESVLAATPGVKLVLGGPGGLEVPNSSVVVRPPEGGNHVCLTIDDVIQHLAEKEVQTIFATWQPKSCFIIVQDPKNGDILACAVRPTFDPNRYGSFPRWAFKKRAVTDIYEPGSVFKVVTASAALEDKRVTPETQFHCPGFVKVYDVTMGCTGTHGTISIREAIEKSCNVVMAKVGRLVGPESLYYYIRKFGFGEKTDIGLPGEALGLVRLPTDWSGISSSAISIGQEIGVTGLQMVTAVSVIANGGMLVKPQVVHRIVASDGQGVVRENSVEFRRRVISEDVARCLASMMQRVVVHGTGRRGKLDQYTAAGKTGTSQKLGPGQEGLKVVSFAGFVPVLNPAVTIYVVVNEPQTDDPAVSIAGGSIAAPAFRNLAGKVMLYLGVPPDSVAEDDATTAVTRVGALTPLSPQSSPPVVVAADDLPVELAGADDDPIAQVLDGALAPLPGLVGIGSPEPVGEPVDEPASAELEIGRVIDAAVQRRYMLGTTGRAALGP